MLIETALDNGHDDKVVTVLARLGMRAKLPVLCVLVTLSEADNPAAAGVQDVAKLRVRMVHPAGEKFRTMLPTEYAEWLFKLRNREREARWGAAESVVPSPEFCTGGAK